MQNWHSAASFVPSWHWAHLAEGRQGGRRAGYLTLERFFHVKSPTSQLGATNWTDIEKEVMRRERYRSHSECYESFLRHWALSQQEHALTGGWASLSPEERTALDADLRQLVESGTGKKGSWLKARIYEAIKELLGADAKSPTVEQVMVKLPEAVRRALKGGKQ